MNAGKTSKKARAGSRMTPEMIAALSAMIIGVSALFVSIYQASIMREQQRIMHEQQRASVWPYLETGFMYDDDAGLRFRVMNQGVGPARIKSVEATVDGTLVLNWNEMLEAMLENPRVPYARRSINGRVLAPEALVRIFGIEGPLADSVGANLDRLEMHICYCSVYDDCWTTTLLRFDAQPVEVCEVDEARQFRH